MTIKPLYLALLLSLTLFISCDKSQDTEPQPEENKIPKIKTETRYSNGNFWYTNTYEYDQEGRIAKLSNEDIITTYQYEPGKVIIKNVYNKSGQIYNDTLLLNNKGFVAVSDDFNYEYDAEGYRILAPDFLTTPPSALTLTILNGNMVKSTPKYWNEYVMQTSTYKFQAGLNTIGDENKGIFWNGTQNKNLMSEEYIKTVTPGRTYELLSTFTYEFDTKIRVSKKTITSGERENYIL